MPPELYEQEGQSYLLEDADTETPQYVGAPTEYADAEEVPEVIGALAKALAGIGLVSPVVILVSLLVVSCGLCALVTVAAGLGLP